MKFLLFNVIVAGALVYLFGAGPVKQVATEGVAVAVDFTDKAVEALRQNGLAVLAEKPASSRETFKKERMPELQSKFVNVKTAPATTPAAKTPSASPSPVIEVRETKPTPLPPIVEVVEVRTSPVHKMPIEKKVSSGVPQANAPQFMTPRQRWRELNRLAYDMEVMFADKMAR
jgi:hypothetical protein